MKSFFKYSALVIALLFGVAAVFYWQLTRPPVQAEKPIVTGVNYVGVTVSDIEQSASLYHNAFQLTAAQHQNWHSSNNNTVKELAARESVQLSSRLLSGVNAQLKLMHFASPSQLASSYSPMAVNGPGIAHVCFQVNENTQSYQKFLAGGGQVIGDKDMIQISAKNPVKYAYAKDLDNTIVEIEHVDVEALNLATPPKNDYRIRHVSLATSDMNRAVNFYSQLLETQSPRRAGRLMLLKGEKLDKISGLANSEIEMAWFQVRNLELELIQYHTPAPQTSAEQIPHRPIDALGYNMIMFNVTDLAKVKATLVNAGASIVLENADWDDTPTLFARDPDGNLLGFQVLEHSSPYSAKRFKDNGIS